MYVLKCTAAKSDRSTCSVYDVLYIYSDTDTTSLYVYTYVCCLRDVFSLTTQTYIGMLYIYTRDIYLRYYDNICKIIIREKGHRTRGREREGRLITARRDIAKGAYAYYSKEDVYV